MEFEELKQLEILLKKAESHFGWTGYAELEDMQDRIRIAKQKSQAVVLEAQSAGAHYDTNLLEDIQSTLRREGFNVTIKGFVW